MVLAVLPMVELVEVAEGVLEPLDHLEAHPDRFLCENRWWNMFQMFIFKKIIGTCCTPNGWACRGRWGCPSVRDVSGVPNTVMVDFLEIVWENSAPVLNQFSPLLPFAQLVSRFHLCNVPCSSVFVIYSYAKTSYKNLSPSPLLEQELKSSEEAFLRRTSS